MHLYSQGDEGGTISGKPGRQLELRLVGCAQGTHTLYKVSKVNSESSIFPAFSEPHRLLHLDICYLSKSSTD